MIIVPAQGTTYEEPDPTPAQRGACYLVTLTGTDGTVWDLNHGPVTLCEGVRLFDAPPVTQFLKRSPGIAGGRRTGVKVEEQTLLLPVGTHGKGWQAWREVDTDFFAGLDPDGIVTVTVTSPDSISKRLPCWFTGVEEDLTDAFDPLLKSYRYYQLGFLAPGAYWQGPDVSRSFSVQAPRPLFPGPPFNINAGSTAQSATISNPGDVPAWPRYTIRGPATSFTVGLGIDGLISSTKPLPSGGLVVIDSDPTQRTIRDETGARIFENMDTVAFRPVPPGAEVPLTIVATGVSSLTSVDVALTPLYRRPL